MFWPGIPHFGWYFSDNLTDKVFIFTRQNLTRRTNVSSLPSDSFQVFKASFSKIVVLEWWLNYTSDILKGPLKSCFPLKNKKSFPFYVHTFLVFSVTLFLHNNISLPRISINKHIKLHLRFLPFLFFCFISSVIKYIYFRMCFHHCFFKSLIHFWVHFFFKFINFEVSFLNVRSDLDICFSNGSKNSPMLRVSM